MTKAAEQCRVWIITEYPGTPVSRFACRNTADGGISQHSAYGSPGGIDSNAIDVFGPGKTGSAADQAWIQEIVDAIQADGEEKWSIRKIIFKDGGAHENHAHIDFYPMVQEKKWCGASWDPTWKHSDGSVIQTRDPEPENGSYNGGDTLMPTEQWHQMIDALFLGRPDEFKPPGGEEYWKYEVSPDSEEWEDFWGAFVRVISP